MSSFSPATVVFYGNSICPFADSWTVAGIQLQLAFETCVTLVRFAGSCLGKSKGSVTEILWTF